MFVVLNGLRHQGPKVSSPKRSLMREDGNKVECFPSSPFFLSFLVGILCSSPSLKEKGVISSASDVFSGWGLALISASMSLTYAESLFWFHQTSFLPALPAYFGIKRHFPGLFSILKSYLADFTLSLYFPLPYLCNYTGSFHLLLCSDACYFCI